jgi:hypothetical protein
MKAKRTTICIIALIGVFALLVGVPAGAKDDLGVSEAKSDMTKAAEAGRAKAEHGEDQCERGKSINPDSNQRDRP